MAETNKVIEALHAKQKEDGIADLEHRLAVMREEAAALKVVIDNFESVQTTYSMQAAEFEKLQTKESELCAQRNQLGVFAGKEKRRIDSELAQLALVLEQAQAKVYTLAERLGGFQTKQDAEQALTVAQSTATDLERQIAEIQERSANTYSFDYAVEVLEKNKQVRECLIEKDPLALTQFDFLRGAQYIRFGRYPKTSKTDIAPIEWIILKQERNRALLLSRYAIDGQRFTCKITNDTWESCSLRTWLNETFLNTAFSSVEQERIQCSDKIILLSVNDFEQERIQCSDKIILLSVNDLNKYFNSEKDRRCQGTPYCHAQGAYVDKDGYCLWLLRSLGRNAGSVAGISGSGYISNFKINDVFAVRPALWLSLDF